MDPDCGVAIVIGTGKERKRVRTFTVVAFVVMVVGGCAYFGFRTKSQSHIPLQVHLEISMMMQSPTTLLLLL